MDAKEYAEQSVIGWNSTFPVGKRVRYWKGIRHGTGDISTTRSKAEILSDGHTAVIWLEGVTGCIRLSHLEPME